MIETPGHTKGHVSYHFPDDKLVFVGDTLFSVGCGKLLEGDAKMMWASLAEADARCRPRPRSIAATNIPTTIAASR